jgi:hypothetical protein
MKLRWLFCFRPLLVRAEKERKARIMYPDAEFAIRCRGSNPLHHLWNNNGTWWCHLTIHLPGFTKERVRISLETHDVSEAKQLRDSLLALFGVKAALAAAKGAVA